MFYKGPISGLSIYYQTEGRSCPIRGGLKDNGFAAIPSLIIIIIIFLKLIGMARNIILGVGDAVGFMSKARIFARKLSPVFDLGWEKSLYTELIQTNKKVHKTPHIMMSGKVRLYTFHIHSSPLRRTL